MSRGAVHVDLCAGNGGWQSATVDLGATIASANGENGNGNGGDA